MAALFDRIVQVQKQYRQLMLEMALSFGRTFVPRFGRVFENQPKAGARAWKNLTPEEKQMYTQKEIMRVQQEEEEKEEKERSVQPTMQRVIQRSSRPMGFQRRTLNASKNARRSWRHQLPRRPVRRPKPVRRARWQNRVYNKEPFDSQ